MMMKRLCKYCNHFGWMNKCSEKYNAYMDGWRCTKCGYPTSSNPAKKDHQETLMRKLAGRLA